jgi:hypothetical protein
VRTTSGTYHWSCIRNGLHRVTRMSIKNIVPHTYDEVVGPSVDDMQYLTPKTYACRNQSRKRTNGLLLSKLKT